jgi:hypothetical protein
MDLPLAAGPKHDDLVRLPGLYRRWELQQLAEPDTELYIEPAGTSADGTCLLSVYRRPAKER